MKRDKTGCIAADAIPPGHVQCEQKFRAKLLLFTGTIFKLPKIRNDSETIIPIVSTHA